MDNRERIKKYEKYIKRCKKKGLKQMSNKLDDAKRKHIAKRNVIKSRRK